MTQAHEMGQLRLELSETRAENAALRAERDAVTSEIGPIGMSQCSKCRKGWPHPSVLSTFPVCESCRRAEREALRESLRDCVEEIDGLVNQFLDGVMVGWPERMKATAVEAADKGRALLEVPHE